MKSWHSHPKIYNIGHRATNTLFEGSVVVEEKIDGSQFSFGVYDGQLVCRSKGQQLDVDAPEKLFTAAVATAKRLAPYLRDGWMYRAEYLLTPKHNVIKYDRIPAGHLIIFDICTDKETYLPYHEKRDEASRLGLECVPRLFEGFTFLSFGIERAVKEWVPATSVLGGTPEGVVVKAYGRFDADGKMLCGKYVTDDFKETKNSGWQKPNPKSNDIIAVLSDALGTEARWRKAYQRLRDEGKLTQTSSDIGLLVQEIQRDVMDECREDVVDALMNWAVPQINKGVVQGAAQWYKNLLLENAQNPADKLGSGVAETSKA